MVKLGRVDGYKLNGFSTGTMRNFTMFNFARQRHLRFGSKTLHNSTMTAFTLYGARGSTNTDRVRLMLAEAGFTDYKLELLNLQKGEQKVCAHVGRHVEICVCRKDGSAF